jgi:hypothetical protein
MAETEKILKRYEYAECPAPPVPLTPEDCAAAGFTFDDECRARYLIVSLTDLMLLRSAREFQLNFSPQRQHHAVLFKGFRHGRGARLWVDGRPAPVRVDVHRNPRVAALLHWLDSERVSEAGNLVRPTSLQAWMREAGPIIESGYHRLFGAAYLAPPQELTPEECKAAGFEFCDERCAYSCCGEGRVCIDFSPDLRHHAVSVRSGWGGALLWVDGEAVPVPRDSQGDPLCEDSATWLDNRFVYDEFGGLWDHPMCEPSAIDRLGGNLRGLLIWDAVNCVLHIEHPEPTQTWRHPFIEQRDDTWRIYPDSEAFRQDRPDRVLPIPVRAGEGNRRQD